MIDRVVEAGLIIMAPKDVLRRERRTERKGALLGEQGLTGLKSLLYEAVAIEDESRRYVLVRGYSEAFSEHVFPTPQTNVLSHDAMSAINAQWAYLGGVEKIVTEAVNAARESRSYQRLDMQHFLGVRR